MMKFGNFLALVWVILFSALPACATSREPMASDAQNAVAKCDKLHQNLALSPLRTKVVLGSLNGLRNPSRKMLKDRDFPSKDELSAVESWAEIRRKCLGFLLATSYLPSVHDDIFHKKSSNLLSGLQSRKLTFGQFNLRMARTKLEYKKALAEEDQYWDKGAEIGKKRAAAIAASMPKPEPINIDTSVQTTKFYTCSVSGYPSLPGYATVWISCY